MERVASVTDLAARRGGEPIVPPAVSATDLYLRALTRNVVGDIHDLGASTAMQDTSRAADLAMYRRLAPTLAATAARGTQIHSTAP